MQPNPYDCLIYWSKADSCWTAHSLRTDQIGLGDGPLYALVDMLNAVIQVMEVAKEDETVQPWREAPRSVQAKFEKAEPLPKEMCEVAYKMVHGEWPAYIRVECDTRKKFAVEQLPAEEFAGV